MELEQETMYMKKGQVQNITGALLGLIVTVVVAILVIIFGGALGGKTYETVESDISAITNTSIRDSINGGIVASFGALEDTGELMPLVVLAVIIGIVIASVVGIAVFAGAGAGGRGGMAL